MSQLKPPEDMLQMTTLGKSIEKGSFAVIDAEIGEHKWPKDQWTVVRRVIHATADFEFTKICKFHPQAISNGIDALRSGCNILVDVHMISIGLNQNRLDHYGCKTYCFINDQDVIKTAKQQQNTTRAIEAMKKAQKKNLLKNSVIAIGNAPTALLHLAKIIEDQQDNQPALVIGVPVGFISAAQSKQRISCQTKVPWIITQGRKGGSPIAVAIIHALLSLAIQS